MIFPLYIAKRYLIAKKSHNLINIITLVSVIGITIGTMALVIVLSVFNGFEGLVTSLFNSFNPDIQVTAARGKDFHVSAIPMDELQRLPGVKRAVQVVEESALALFDDRQYLITLKGVDSGFEEIVPLGDHLLEGRYLLRSGERSYAVIGAGVAYYLGIYPEDFSRPMTIFLPKRTRQSLTGLPDQVFNSSNVSVSGVFSIQQDLDMQYVILPVERARELLEYTDEVTALEIGLLPGADQDVVRQEIERLLGPSYLVKNRFEQQALLYRIMKTEKWAVYLILTFILVIAAFNMIGSLSMLIIDKKKDIAVLWSMGASKKLIKRVFFAEGMLMSLAGGATGLVAGAVIALLQQHFGLLKLGGGEGSFIVEAYPVRVEVMDMLYVLVTVMVIGALSTWYPVRQVSKKYLSSRINYFLMR